ncbi:uncharacterized protein LOC101273690 [Orcinus orca]|uniref:uncharacterized protein LOC101273690 n=1 Tax=Orcinus orca TaxID=9733 RepID=UPI002111C53F|nr:uncharacterized protein LOC101273690 [Orcinus orca]
MKVFEVHFPWQAYSLDESFFWAHSAGNHLTVILNHPADLRRVQVLPGTIVDGKHALEKGQVELGYEPEGTPQRCTSLALLGHLLEGQLDQEVVPRSVGHEFRATRGGDGSWDFIQQGKKQRKEERKENVGCWCPGARLLESRFLDAVPQGVGWSRGKTLAGRPASAQGLGLHCPRGDNLRGPGTETLSLGSRAGAPAAAPAGAPRRRGSPFLEAGPHTRGAHPGPRAPLRAEATLRYLGRRARALEGWRRPTARRNPASQFCPPGAWEQRTEDAEVRRDGLTSGSSLSSSPSSHPVPLFTVFQGGQVLRGLLSSPLAPTHWAPGGAWLGPQPTMQTPTPLRCLPAPPWGWWLMSS